MAKTSKKKKLDDLRQLNANLCFFYPKLSDIFMCPICLKKISLQNYHEISGAHIIPKAAGGNKKTFLCRKCNSDFGSKQDKWFGEFIRLRESNENIIQTKIQNGFFFLGDKKVGGKFKYTPENGLKVLIHKNLNSPQINNYVLNEFPNEKNKTFSFELPILQNKRMISIGYLTAAYLLWFEMFGYSWALQSHLDQIRQQILFPDKLIINNLFVVSSENIKHKSWIGMVMFSGFLTLAAGFSGNMILIPSISCRDLYEKLDEIISTHAIEIST